MKEQQVIELLKRYKEGSLSPMDKAKLETWYISETSKSDARLDDDDLRESLDHLREQLALKYKIASKPLGPHIAIAAAILIAIGFGFYFYSNTDFSSQYAKQEAVQDIAPGGNKAILTLSDGQKIILADAEYGELANQSGIKITKAADGQLIYESIHPEGSKKAPHSAKVAYNRIETPRGGQYEIILPDKSRVWLNSLSSLRYPTYFNGKERRVELTGEAYFEVAHNKSLPFKVETNNQIVEVLGTQFNINSYTEEPSTKTTLIEGSVKVFQSSSNQYETLAPGQQSILTKGDKLSKINKAQIAEAIAWKNKLFHFENSNIEVVMRQLSRWYDVEVEYEGKIPEVKLSGEIYRNTNATKVLDILSFFNIKYRIEELPGGKTGKKIIISQ